MKKKITIYTTSAIVIANMIGTGVFTSVGFQLSSVQNTWSVLFLWLAGGILALFGAFAYAELRTHFKESGGDYIYLSKVFHPLLGYLSAWAGLTVGFSAPVDLAAMARENTLWKPLAQKNSHGIPVAAIWVHVFISIALTLTGSFEKVLLYAGFVLQLMASLTVASSLFLNSKKGITFKSPFKPVLQIIFLVFNGYVLVFTLIDRPVESLIGLGVLLAGGIIYYFDQPVLPAEESD